MCTFVRATPHIFVNRDCVWWLGGSSVFRGIGGRVLLPAKSSGIFGQINSDIVALLHQFHDADGFILLHLVGFVSGFTVGLVVGVADLWSLGIVATRSHQRIVANSHRLIKGHWLENNLTIFLVSSFAFFLAG